MPIRLDEIAPGRTYRFFGFGGRELKERTVMTYDPHGRYLGGTVRARVGGTYIDTYAGDYFARHAAQKEDANG